MSDSQTVQLSITGMTCGSCAARIERKLSTLDHVEAAVNLATEKAEVHFSAPTTVAQIVEVVEATGYGAQVLPSPSAGRPTVHPATDALPPEDLQTADSQPAVELTRQALISVALTVPLVALAMIPGLAFTGSRWVQLALATPVVLWAAWPFHRAAVRGALHRSSTMDTLVSLGVLAAYGWSLVTLITGGPHLYFETAAVITTFLLIGRSLEARAKARSKDALSTLLTLGAKDVAVQRIDATTRASTEVRIPIGELVVGDHFVVRPGEKVATDGIVIEGSSALNESLLTGESLPVDVTKGSDVTGGAINGHGRLIVKATKVGADTTLSGIARLVEQAQMGKAGIERLADRVSSIFVPIVLVLAALTFVGWWIGSGSASTALSVAIAVLVIACPCALGLATPTALLVGSGRGAQLGILIKGPQVLEDTRRIDTIVFDKTGTLTAGAPTLTDVTTHGRLSLEAALRAAAAVEAGSEHPIAQAITGAARERGLEIPAATGFTALAGSGAVATINGTEVTVGRAELFDDVPDDLPERADGSTIWLGWGGAARATLTVADDLRAGAREAVSALQDQDLTAYLLTGDREAVALSIAAQVGIAPERVISGVHPADKHAMIQRLQDQGGVVAMVGDGINDAAALAQADLGIAMGTGTDVAAASADIVLMRPQVAQVAEAIALSRATLRVIKQNLGWAFGYNVAAIPLAMAGLLNPMIAAAAMAASSVLVVANSLRLRAFASDQQVR